MNPPGDNTTLVCFAVAEEARPFRRITPGLPPVRVLVTGMGRRNAEATIEAWFHHDTPSIVITSGFAGGLDPALRVGDVLYEADPGFPWVGRVAATGAKPGRFHCAERIAVTQADKQRLRDSTGADAVEMESEPIRRACQDRGIASATIRVISDAAGEDLPLDFNALTGPGLEIDYLKLAGSLMRCPRKVPELLRFQRRVHSAAQTLARALAAIIRG